jgi:protein-S-isoprenylcysteine O-methyltransferase Ste14
MDPKARMWTGLVVSLGLIALALFVPAGTPAYWQAWAYLGISSVTSVLLALVIVKDPILLASRTRGGPSVEKRPVQKLIVACVAIIGIAAFVVPGLDRRFGWSSVPSWLCVAGDIVILVSMWMVGRVFKANSFGSATVEVVEGQKVISTGPYALVRHPMYSSAALYFVGLSLALGSYWGLVAAGLTILTLVWRLFDEEALLARELPGYAEYCGEVRWHLIPGVF